MGLFDRWRRPTVRRYEFAGKSVKDRPIIVDRDGTADYARRNNAENWLWLLLIPLFFLLLLGAYTYLGNPNLNTFKNNTKSFFTRLFNRQQTGSANSNTTASSNNNGNTDNGLRFGIGGAAPTATPIPTATPKPTTTPKPTVTSSQSSGGATVTPTPTGSSSQSVQSASERKIPEVAPATGRAN